MLSGVVSANHSLYHSDRSSPSVNDCPSINSRQPVMQKVNRSRRTSLWKGSGACLSCCCEHLPDAPKLGAERCFKPSTLHWSLLFGNSRWHGSTMGRRSGGLVASAHGRGSTASSRPSCVIRDAVNYKLDRLPLPVNDLVVLGHQRRRWRMSYCASGSSC